MNEKHMVTIVVDQYLNNSAIYEHRCLENIKELYKSAGKCDDQQQYKAIVEAAKVSTPEVFNYNSPMSPIQYLTLKNPIARKLLCQFLDTLEVKPKTDFLSFVPIDQSAKKSELGLCCGTVYQSHVSIQKSINRSKKIFKVGFYDILSLWCLQ